MARVMDLKIGSNFGPCGMKIGSSFQTPITPNNCWGGPFLVENVSSGISVYAKVSVENSGDLTNQAIKLTCHCGVWRRSIEQPLNSDGAAIFDTIFESDIEGCGIAPGAYRLHFELMDRNNNSDISAAGIVRILPGIFKSHKWIA